MRKTKKSKKKWKREIIKENPERKKDWKGRSENGDGKVGKYTEKAKWKIWKWRRNQRIKINDKGDGNSGEEGGGEQKIKNKKEKENKQ
jgi:hypothetical protein